MIIILKFTKKYLEKNGKQSTGYSDEEIKVRNFMK